MKLLEKIKSLPKKTLIIIAVLTVMLVTTVIVSIVLISTSRDGNGESINTGEPQNVGVFNPIDDTDKATDKPLETQDLTDVAGLNYISRGDGTCYIVGIGSCTKTELEIPEISPTGDKVTKIYDGAFANCEQLVSVYIPSTVRSIGTGAFRGCTNLVAINVDDKNAVYCSVGSVLFSKDKSVLVCYPMNRQGANYLLSTSVKAISAFAFEGAVNLKKILFEGNIAKFQSIDILIGNDIINTLPITCNYVSAK